MLYQKNVNIDFWIIELIESIKAIRAGVEEQVAVALKFNFPEQMSLVLSIFWSKI